MVINGESLLQAAPIERMEKVKFTINGFTYGLSEAGYDIRIKQDICFGRDLFYRKSIDRIEYCDDNVEIIKHDRFRGRFVLASSVERFTLSPWIMGVVHDKSSWARKGLSVFNTVLEPGWEGYLTLELVYHGKHDLIIPAGTGIAQVIFHEVASAAHYKGRYQNQANHPVSTIPAMSDTHKEIYDATNAVFVHQST